MPEEYWDDKGKPPSDGGYSERKIRSVLKNPTGQDNNRDEMLNRVAQDPLALRFATEELRGDREVVMTAAAQEPIALFYATEELRGDREVVMTAVTSNGQALKYATEELRGDRGVVMAAVAKDGSALEYATQELRGDREVVMTAVARNGWVVNDASEELRGDREVMEAALAVVAAHGTGVHVVGLKARLDPACLLSWLCLKEKKIQQHLAHCACSLRSSTTLKGSRPFLLVFLSD